MCRCFEQAQGVDAYYAKGEYDKAIADLQAVLSIDPNNADAKKAIEIIREQQDSR
ncbi:MAG: tetratricopeptide repeat protein [Spirochaetaceae bacterium]|nr:tetratricopeptide repeat protein [Spirochaetaceae bacterium]